MILNRGVMIVTQEDIDEGTEFYCLCHGWHKLENPDDFCPGTYVASTLTTRNSESISQ